MWPFFSVLFFLTTDSLGWCWWFNVRQINWLSVSWPPHVLKCPRAPSTSHSHHIILRWMLNKFFLLVCNFSICKNKTCRRQASCKTGMVSPNVIQLVWRESVQLYGPILLVRKRCILPPLPVASRKFGSKFEMLTNRECTGYPVQVVCILNKQVRLDFCNVLLQLCDQKMLI